MARTIVWAAAARVQLRAIDQSTALRILHAFARLTSTGEGDVKRLQEVDPPEYRLRFGDYRVRFRDFGESIEIRSVRHRREAYR